MIRRIGGSEPTEETLQTIHEQTEGNPLFVTEMARYLSQGEEVEWERGMRIPEGVKEVIGRRLNWLSATGDEVLSAAAASFRSKPASRQPSS